MCCKSAGADSLGLTRLISSQSEPTDSTFYKSIGLTRFTSSQSDNTDTATVARVCEFPLSNWYILGALLGSGTTCSVRAAVRKTDGKLFAVKCLLSLDEEARLFTINEYQLLAKLSHPALLRAHDCFQDTSTMFILLDHCAGGDMKKTRVGLRSFGSKRSVLFVQPTFEWNPLLA